MNNGMVHMLAGQFAERVSREAGKDTAKRVELVYRIALSRPPTDDERKLGVETIDELTAKWSKQLPKQGTTNIDVAAMKALTTYCHAIVNSAAFLYVD